MTISYAKSEDVNFTALYNIIRMHAPTPLTDDQLNAIIQLHALEVALLHLEALVRRMQTQEQVDEVKELLHETVMKIMPRIHIEVMCPLLNVSPESSDAQRARQVGDVWLVITDVLVNSNSANGK